MYSLQKDGMHDNIIIKRCNCHSFLESYQNIAQLIILDSFVTKGQEYLCTGDRNMSSHERTGVPLYQG